MGNSWQCKISPPRVKLSWRKHIANRQRGALEPQFFAKLLQGLSLTPSDLPGPREDPSTWPALRELISRTFQSKTRTEWQSIFDGTDACCTPVFTQGELESSAFVQRPIVTLRDTPGFAIADGSEQEEDMAIKAAHGQGPGTQGQGWQADGLSPGVGGEDVLSQWTGWRRGTHFEVAHGGLVFKDGAKL
jgi:alpha-methylacyl-CoA racemase